MQREKLEELQNKSLNKILKFSIDNFRVFDKPNVFEFAPITLITGPNNSGKSSLVKSLLMLKNNKNKEVIPFEIILPNNSVQLSSAVEILYERDKSFSFEIYFSNRSYDKVLLTFSIDLLCNSDLLFDSITVFNKNKKVLMFTIERPFPGAYSINPFSIIDFKFWMKYVRKEFETEENIKSHLYKFYNDKTNFKRKKNNYLLFELQFEDSKLGILSKDDNIKFELIQNQLINEIYELNKPDFELLLKNIITEYSMKEEDDLYNLDNIFNDRIEHVLKFYLRFELSKRVELEIPGNFILRETEFYYYFEKFYNRFMKNFGLAYSNLTDIEILPISKGTSDRNFQPDDNNLSFLSRASIKLDQARSIDSDKHQEFIKWINEWLLKFDIGKSLEIVNIDNRNIYTIEVIDLDDKKRNLKDLGYGVSQVISILLSPYISDFSIDDLSYIKGQFVVDKSNFLDKQPTYYLEEPESNFHPNWQSKLLELLVDINKRFGIRFIIETHSEYMIRKLQNLVSKKTVNKDKVKIYYFNSDKYVSEKEPKVKEIKLKTDGVMENSFGPGFYDEAINLEFELLTIRKYQDN